MFNVNAVATKGLAGENNPFTKTYSLSYSTSGVNWKNYEENGAVKVSATPLDFSWNPAPHPGEGVEGEKEYSHTRPV